MQRGRLWLGPPSSFRLRTDQVLIGDCESQSVDFGKAHRFQNFVRVQVLIRDCEAQFVIAVTGQECTRERWEIAELAVPDKG